MPKPRTLVILVLGASTLLVAALVGVLTLGGSEPLEDDGPRAGLIAPRSGPGAVALPVPEARDRAEPVPPPEPPRAPAAPPTGPNVIVGRVVDDETGVPVPSYTVKIMPHADRPPLERLATEPGNPVPVRAVAGVFRLERKPGRWDVVVQASTYEPGVLLDVELPRHDGRALELRLSHGPSIVGVVYDESNTVLADVPVFLHVLQLTGAGPPPRNALARTDAAGRFRFSPLPAGLYAISALEPDGTDRVRDIPLDGGRAEVAVYVAPRQQLVVAARDPWGRPLADARVELRGGATLASDTTNAAGQAQLRFLKPGRYELRVQREGYAALTEPVELVGASGEAVRWCTLQPEP